MLLLVASHPSSLTQSFQSPAGPGLFFELKESFRDNTPTGQCLVPLPDREEKAESTCNPGIALIIVLYSMADNGGNIFDSRNITCNARDP